MNDTTEIILKPKKEIKKILLQNEVRMIQEHIIHKKHKYWNEIDTLCFLSKNLYNHSIFLLRKNLEENLRIRKEFKEINPEGKFPKFESLSFFQLDPLLRNNSEFPDYKKLPAQTSQQIVKKISEVWSSYQQSLFTYFKTPSNFKGRPEPPKFKHKTDGRFVVIYTGANGISKVSLRNGIIKPSGTSIEIPFHLKDVKITEVRFIPMPNQQYKVEIVYIKTVVHENLEDKNHLYLDLGIDNLITGTDNIGNKPFTISGKLIKSVNRKYNDDIARLTSVLQLQNPFRKNSRQIEKIRNDRNNKIKSLFHKISKNIVDHCIKHKIKIIIVGKNDGWKQNLSDRMSKEFNQKFTQIPYQLLINQLKYKLHNIGGELIEQQESHTSKCDHLAMEEICHQEKYLGTRNNKKAIFKSSTGIVLHDDVNGCIGIGRKYLNNKENELSLVNLIKEKQNYYPKRLNIKL